MATLNRDGRHDAEKARPRGSLQRGLSVAAPAMGHPIRSVQRGRRPPTLLDRCGRLAAPCAHERCSVRQERGLALRQGTVHELERHPECKRRCAESVREEGAGDEPQKEGGKPGAR